MKEVRFVLRWQPAYWVTAVGAAMVPAGFAVLLLGWRGAAALLLVPLQLPYAISGGLAGLALVGFGAALLNLQVTRHLAARERARTGQVIREATHLIAAARPVGSAHAPQPPAQGRPVPRVSPRPNGETPIRRRPAGGTCFAAILLGAVVLLAVPRPAVADSAEEVGTSVEAWYRGNLLSEDDPLCSVPCPQLAAPEGPYPENTLHVGVSGGRETARTYFSLDMSGLPVGPTVTGGTVRLPVAGVDAGTTTPEVAELVACAVDGVVQSTEGGPPSQAPPVDCSRSALLELDDDGEVFTFDLAPLTTAEPIFGDFKVAVIASDLAREEAQTWRVAFHGRDRDTDDAEPITARIRYRSHDDVGTQEPAVADVESDPQAGPAPPPPDDGPTDGAAPVPSFGSGQLSAPTFDDPPPPTVAAKPPPRQQDTAQPTVATPMAADLAYPQLWLLPMVFLAVGGVLTRSLSQAYVVDLDDAPSTL